MHKSLSSSIALGLLSAALSCMKLLAGTPFRIQLDTIREGYDGKTCFTQARAGIVPRNPLAPLIVITMNPLVMTGSDVYLAVNEMRSEDMGASWSGPIVHPSLGRRPRAPIDGKDAESGVCDLWPKWHAGSQRLISIGHTVHYTDERHPATGQPRTTAYSAYSPENQSWTEWKELRKPDGSEPYPYGAGCSQRVDLPDGHVLLPVYGGQRTKLDPYTRARVVKAAVKDGSLHIIEEGDELAMPSKRGFAEPSLATFKGRYYLALRHDDAGYCAVSDDGLHFDEPRPWLWDDGSDLGNYNTQTHWVTHDDALYLVYTRKGANNDHVFRHRAPLFIAEFDTTTRRVRRDTERVLIPERGARYGNFGVCDISPDETWIVETEWMQTWKKPSIVIPVDNPWNAKNRVYAARILWDRPNTGWDKR